MKINAGNPNYPEGVTEADIDGIGEPIGFAEEDKETVTEIVDDLYRMYGTDSGVLFGISERIIVEKIVRFALENN